MEAAKETSDSEVPLMAAMRIEWLLNNLQDLSAKDLRRSCCHAPISTLDKA